MSFIGHKTLDGTIKGKLSFYCKALGVSRQGFYKHLEASKRPWKYQGLANTMLEIRAEDECNDTYGRVRMRHALKQRLPEGSYLPSEGLVQNIMAMIGISHTKKHKPNGLTKADREAQKSENLIKRNFKAEEPAKKCVTDITEVKGSNGKLYISGIFDCYDATPLGLALDTNMKASLCVQTLKNAMTRYPELRGAIIHSDRGSQYTSQEYRTAISQYGISQSINSAGGRCHDNALCESIWARMKEELIYGRIRTEDYTVEELKQMIWRYFMSYWNNRRICTANGGLPPAVKRRKYYDALILAA